MHSDVNTPQTDVERANADLIRQCYQCWESGDRATLDSLLAADFTFTSPNDDHISKAEYWDVCWVHQPEVNPMDIEVLMVNEREGFARYSSEGSDGRRFRNTEYFQFENGQIKAVEVYFGHIITGK